LRLKVLLVAAGLLAPVFVPAQQPAGTAQRAIPVAPGTRVRVHATTLVAPLIANFLEMRADTAVFFEDGAAHGIWSVPYDKLQIVETSVGHRNFNQQYIRNGAIIGAGVGLVGGLLFAGIFSPSDPTREYSYPLTALVSSVMGASIGAFIGSRRTAEQWAPVQLHSRMSLRMGRSGVGLVYTF
jgi:hypothetical protein